MYHSLSITVDGVSKNTYTDWHLVPKVRPVINPPKPKTHYIDIPGGDGSIDLTDTLAGRPVYANREGDIEFYVLNNYAMEGPSTYNWMDIYTAIMQFLHGKKAMIILEDEPTHYYLGRLTVDNWTTNNDWSTISISYSLEPYKYLVDPVSYTLENGAISISTGENASTDTLARTVGKIQLSKGDAITMVRSKETPVTYSNIASLDASYWQRKGISSATGADLTGEYSTTRLSTIDYLDSGLDIVSVTSDYDYAIFAWDSNGNYQGVWNGSAFVKTGITWLQTATSTKSLPGGYKHRIVLKAHSGLNVTIELGECVNASFSLATVTGGFSGNVGSTITLTTTSSWQRVSFTPTPGKKYRITVSRVMSNDDFKYVDALNSQNVILEQFMAYHSSSGSRVVSATLEFTPEETTVYVKAASGGTLTIEEVNGGTFNMLGPSDHLRVVLYYGTTSSSAYPGMAEGYVHNYQSGGNEFIATKDGYYRFVLAPWSNTTIDAAYRDILKQEVLIKKGGVL